MKPGKYSTMRFFEFNKPLDEGANSQLTQFNSEVGLLAAMCGITAETFNPSDIDATFANSKYEVTPQTLENIKSQIEFYKPEKFKKWANVAGPKIEGLVLKKLEELELPAPTKLEWVAGSNQSSVADVKFVGHVIDGISVKEQGAPTLANMTPKSLGLDKGGELGSSDVFRRFAKTEWDAVKDYVFKKVLEIAKAQPDVAFSPIKPKYSITYKQGEIPAAASRLRPPKPYKIQPEENPEENPEEPIQPNLEQPKGPVKESTEGYFVIKFGDGEVFEPESRILQDLPRNAKWQRVFGDYFQKYWNKDAGMTELGKTMFTKIGLDFVSKIKLGLANQNNLNSAVRMGSKAYFYTTPSSTFYVPAVTVHRGLKLAELTYSSPKGTSQNFLATIGYEGEVPASVLIYIRYANGIFQTDPTVRVQRLTNPQGLGWLKL